MIFKPKNVCIKYDMNSVISQSGRVENAVVLHLPMKYISVSECSIYSTANAVYIQPLMQYIFIFQGYDCLQEFIKYNSRHLSQGSGYCEKKIDFLLCTFMFWNLFDVCYQPGNCSRLGLLFTSSVGMGTHARTLLRLV